MKVSLIVATLNRKDSLNDLFYSLSNQTYKNFEVIVVDQNKRGYLDDLILYWNEKLDIRYKRVEYKGLSRARNDALTIANSDICAFPDDDCRYPNDLLELVLKHFNDFQNTEILICNGLLGLETSVQNQSKKYILPKQIKSILSLFITGACSIQLFFKTSTISSMTEAPFDINMGAGSGTLYGSSEETDLLLRMFIKNVPIYVNKNIRIIHSSDYPDPKKSYLYGLGRYKLITKNKLNFIYYIINIIQPIINIFKRNELHLYKSYIATMIGRSGCVFVKDKYIK